jgi:hypothetical protein
LQQERINLPTFLYQCFGLTLDSALELPCIAAPAHARPDVCVRISMDCCVPVPPHAHRMSQSECQWRDEAGHWHVHYTDILNGAELHFKIDLSQMQVDVGWMGEVTTADIPRVILGPILGRLLLWSGQLALHGNAVQIDDAAVLFCADSGGGKSTASAALVEAGFPLLCDDIARLTSGAPSIQVQPGYPHLRIWRDSAAGLGERWQQLPAVYQRAETMGDKCYRDLQHDTALFCREALPLRAIYLLQSRIAGADQTEMTRVDSRAAFPALVRNVFLQELLESAQAALLFPALSAVANRIPVFAVYAPDGLKYLRGFAADIVHHCRSLQAVFRN